MHFLSELVVAFFTAYLALTNSLAEKVELIFTQNEEQEESTLQKVSSAYDAIPHILIENAAYQSGNVIDTASERVSTTTPLEALVNIFCSYSTDTYTRTTTGTGFFIDDEGIILTNAHVAQFLLLETLEGTAHCTVRTGNPAVATYEANLLYISPAWIQNNAALIDAEHPSGTGERDYAMLYVTAGVDNKPMPSRFPALAIDTTLLPISAIGEDVAAAGYPAVSLFESGDMNADLTPKQGATRIAELMTFGSNYADLMTIEGSAVGEQGASGGPVVNEDGYAIGLISTKGDDAQFGEGALRALTLSYVDRTIKEETGFTLKAYLGGNLPYRSKLFLETLGPFLKRMLERELRD